MKRIIIFFTAVVAAGTVILGVFGSEIIYYAQYNEVHTVQNIAGAVLLEYPQAEQTFVAAVMDKDYESIHYGKKVMSHYGYDFEMELNKRYRKSMTVYFVFLAIFLAAASGCGYAAFSCINKNRKRQEENLIEIMDCCLSGDYGFINDEKRLAALGNPVFADTLTKLAEGMRLKTEYLNKEHDNTKTLVTDISHQLKTPISALKACFYMYIEADSEAEKSEFLTRSKIQMDKLENLITALINISRLESGMITLKRTNVLLTEILTDAVNTMYHKVSAKNISIMISDFEDIWMSLDKKWTSEAVANILDNAVKYSPHGSYVYVRVQKLYSFVRIEIEDEGIGIIRDEQNKIFSRFYRGESEAVKNEEGSGVGLYLTRKILEEQGGTVSVRSASGCGSVFIVQLPL